MTQEDEQLTTAFMNALDQFPSWKKVKIPKMLDGILNDTDRLSNLLSLYESGQISHDELWLAI